MQPDLHRLCARMLMVGFPGPSIDSGFGGLLRSGIFGAILFKRNIGSAPETAELCREIKQRANRPFLMAVDQEGGRVARLRGPPFFELPAMRKLGERGDPSLAESIGRLLAFELSAVGFDWDFAPVLDVDTNPQNPVIGDRSLHRDAQQVARLGVALAQGLEAGGVASCGKHFPGHGDTTQDSHLTLPRLPHSMERLRQIELLPFRAYAQARLAAIMTAHVVFEALEPHLPGTMSAKVLDSLLRRELGFQGVIVSDDLEMKAIADYFPLEEAVVVGALAGVDLFLVCQEAELQRRAIEALIKAAESGRLPRARIEESNRRLDALAHKFAHPPEARLAVLGSAEHRSLASALQGIAKSQAMVS
jgi:beta-N-acetylhexosaminidase